MGKLDGKVAIVTGAGRGIGRAIALELAKEGANIVVVDTDRLESKYNQYGTTEINGYKAAVKVAEEIRAIGRRAMAIESDVTKWDQVKAMVKKALDEFGKIDILVNNAGVITVASVMDLTEEEWDFIMAVNAKGVFLCSKAVIPYMIKRKGGKIINVASIAGKRGYTTLAHYCASKFAVIGFTQALALELAQYNVTVNAICPGIVYTQMWRLLSEKWKKPGKTAEESYPIIVKEMIPLGRDQTPEDIGKLAVFFATMDNVTGQAVNVCGGAEVHA
jgi:meso-butanediol dehydrogenase/(S,S)-butanediol dehydrogenase/diacetyl reductase